MLDQRVIEETSQNENAPVEMSTFLTSSKCYLRPWPEQPVVQRMVTGMSGICFEHWQMSEVLFVMKPQA
jgi:hypothetical protein